MRVLLVGLLLLLAGCDGGPRLHSAGGKVTFADGRPVMAGVVEFAPVDGGPAARGQIQQDGKFTLTTDGRDGAVAGPHRIAVVQLVVLDGADAAARGKHQHKGSRVHPRYARFDTSKLTAEVQAGAVNDVTIRVDPAD